MARKKARESALQTLFAVDMGKNEPDQALRKGTEGLDAEDRTFVYHWLQGVLQHQEEIDARLARFSPEWRLDRMPNVDRQILRLAAYELMYAQDIPTEISINEAVELAKRYGTDDSSRYVNGVLGQLVKEVRAEENQPVAKEGTPSS